MTKIRKIKLVKNLLQTEPVTEVLEVPVTEALEVTQIEKDLQLTMSLNNAIDKIQSEYNVSIGLQLDTQKIKKIIDFMIDNQLTTVSLKYEIWKTH